MWRFSGVRAPGPFPLVALPSLKSCHCLREGRRGGEDDTGLSFEGKDPEATPWFVIFTFHGPELSPTITSHHREVGKCGLCLGWQVARSNFSYDGIGRWILKGVRGEGNSQCLPQFVCEYGWTMVHSNRNI